MTKLPLPLLYLLLLLPLPFLVISQSDSDRSALLAAKLHWGGDLPALSSWNSSTSPCTWTGVQCSVAADGTLAVTGISLSDANIAATIPASICDLKNLRSLDLSWNYIPDGFPKLLYNCSNLTYLDLSMNMFVGAIPSDVDRLSGSLQHLNLSANNFSGDVPKSIGGLKELRTLNLAYNLFDGSFPNEIGNLSNLEYLIMPYNPFTPMALPSDWGRLKKLKFIYMRECNLIGEIPSSFGGLDSLEHLDLVGNGIEGPIPDQIFSLKNLSYLYLYKNGLSGEIPGSIQSLNLIEIDLSQNNLTGSIPADFGKMNSLRVLNLFSNNLIGEIPSGIGSLPQLETLKLFSNRLSGALPSELGLRSKLVALEIGGNRFSGQLPANLCSKGALTGITAVANNLSGEIPKSLENCTALRILMLSNNSFTGEIPSKVWTLPNLYSLMFGFNGFTGRLPSRLSSNMTRLEVNDNNFSGPIPAETATWTSIQVIQAGNNKLSGEIPTGLTRLTKLNSLTLDGNQLSGQLPTAIGSWKSLSKLSLARNRLTGPIPSAIGLLPTLNYLDLSSNELTGQIPDQLQTVSFSFLNLSNNKLTGEIPFALDNEAYESSFLNTSLCASDQSQILTLPKCSSTMTSSSRHISSKFLAIILVVALLVFFTTLCFSAFAVKEWRQKRRGSELTPRKLTSFQRLEFTEDMIMSGVSNKKNVIGSGGSGEVYRVQVTSSGHSVAVKKIWNKEKIDDAQFLAEVQILGTIRHSNIVKLLCCIADGKCRLLVYEYMENQSLDRWVHRRKRLELESRGEVVHVLRWPTRVGVAVGAAQGLSYMHHDCSPPIIHRDVKSSNILLDAEFRARIADFGLAKMAVKRGELHTMSNVAGTFGYLPPEYGRTTKVNEKVDVYSFGVVLLELVTGKEPNSGDEGLNLAGWSWRHYNQERPIAEVLDEEVVDPCNVDEMCNVFILGLMCTSPEPAKRPSMKEVLQVLRRYSQADDGLKKAETVKVERDVTPLLGGTGTAKKGGSRRVVQDVLDMV